MGVCLVGIAINDAGAHEADALQSAPVLPILAISRDFPGGGGTGAGLGFDGASHSLPRLASWRG